MKKLTQILVVSAFVLGTLNTNAQMYYNNQLRVLDPHTSWWGPQGTIESAEYVIKPKGIYAMVDIFLEFSARGTELYNKPDTLEVQFYFNLPTGAVVCDSWLQFGNDWLKAKILDRWTAFSIYEGIVKRRKDPSILTKNGNSYQLNVYPMAPKETRKVKISVMLPFAYNFSSAIVNLPTEFLKYSLNPVNNITVRVQNNSNYQNPAINGNTTVLTADINTFKQSDLIAVIKNENNIEVSFKSPLTDGLFVSKYQKGNEGVYQMAFVPSQALNLVNNKKVLVLIDFDKNSNNNYYNSIVYDSKTIFNETFSMLRKSLLPTDSFNIIFSGLKTKKLSNKWIQADSASISQMQKSVSDTIIAGYSNLTLLLTDGVDFISKTGNNASILLVSNSTDYGSNTVANELVNDIEKLYPKLPPINILNFYNGYSYYYFSDGYYNGNDYLYTMLSRKTSGNYIKVEGTELFSDKINLLAQSISGLIPAFDMFTTLESGFCYARYSVSNSQNVVYLNRPILTTGKFYGDFPFKVDISGMYNNKTFRFTKTITAENIIAVDTTAIQAWVGNMIENKITQNNQNDVVAEIIKNSIENRVLTDYTAFLALEPDYKIEPCTDCSTPNPPRIMENWGMDMTMNWRNTIDVKQQTANVEVSVSPNPFTDNLKVDINLGALNEKIVLEIYNLTGQLIYSKNFANNTINFVWNGNDNAGKEVSKGTYILVIKTKNTSKNIKVIKM